ncbi:Putative D-3-phosphoglycerate dehydrogenase [Magnetospirillum sp. XM-1]|uniref:C-terminal binding protein n=1 Tax=Magnetospirillum sp. XM-1 TaxID=1663591 RepID=UPI00073DCAB9|nr:C-terminal binding protein [Magnetospirillum sp. XM-1]CUW38009.1 Putative D-3-phosphoglycerate dehydrogenase [Magnetospirillum sp. XM-1]
MSAFKIVYTDPMWAVGADGEIDPGSAALERAVYGSEAELVLGRYEAGAFVKEGPAFLDLVRGADALVIYRAQITPEVVAAIKPSCKVVARQGVGFDNLNAPLLAANGIYGLNVPDYCVDEVTTHTLSLVLALERQLCLQNQRLKGGTWNIFDGGYPRRTNDLTAGIIGFGRIGRASARKLQAFYGRVLAYDPYVHNDLMRGYGVTKCDRLEDLLGQSDVVVIHALLDDGSKFMINRESIASIRQGALLVNTARGNLVQPEAVLDSLREGRLGGYGSDVFTPEDPNEHPINRQILGFDNVVVTSHRAFLSDTAERSQRTRVAEEIRRVLRDGQPPLFGRLA